MKNLAFIFFSLFFVQSLVAQIPTVGLIANYEMDEGLVNDFSINENHGTLTGMIEPGEDRFGNPTGAGYFDGGENYFDVFSEDFIFTHAISISIWINVEEHQNGWVGLVNRWYTEPFVDGGYYLGINPSEHKVRWNATAIAADGDPIPTNEWIHIVAIYEVEGTFRLYMNGQLVHQDWALEPMPIYKVPFRVGQQSQYFPSAGDYKGSMDQVLIYDRGLSEAEVQQIFEYEPEPIISGISNSELSKEVQLVSVYPNPATDVLYLNELTAGQFSAGYLMNNSGQRLQYIRPGQTQILTSGLPAGMYLVRLQYEDLIETIPFIKQ